MIALSIAIHYVGRRRENPARLPEILQPAS
jgi:hypothetical protein